MSWKNRWRLLSSVVSVARYESFITPFFNKGGVGTLTGGVEELDADERGSPTPSPTPRAIARTTRHNAKIEASLIFDDLTVEEAAAAAAAASTLIGAS